MAPGTADYPNPDDISPSERAAMWAALDVQRVAATALIIRLLLRSPQLSEHQRSVTIGELWGELRDQSLGRLRMDQVRNLEAMCTAALAVGKLDNSLEAGDAAWLSWSHLDEVLDELEQTDFEGHFKWMGLAENLIAAVLRDVPRDPPPAG